MCTYSARLLFVSSHGRYLRLNCSDNEITSLPDFLCTMPKLNAYVPRAYCVTDVQYVLTPFLRLWCNNNKLTSFPERITEMKSLRRCAAIAVTVLLADLRLAPQFECQAQPNHGAAGGLGAITESGEVWCCVWCCISYFELIGGVLRFDTAENYIAKLPVQLLSHSTLKKYVCVLKCVLCELCVSCVLTHSQLGCTRQSSVR